jgi:hypothetical protein
MSTPPTPRDRLWDTCGAVHRIAAAGVHRVFGLVDKVAGRLPLPAQLSASLALLAGMAFTAAAYGERLVVSLFSLTPGQIDVLAQSGFLRELEAVCQLALVSGGVLLVAAGAVWWRNRVALVVARTAAALFVCAWALLIHALMNGPTLLLQSEAAAFHRYMRNEAWMTGLTVTLPGSILAALTVLLLMRGSLTAWYTNAESDDKPRLGDRALAALRGNGKDPQFQSSAWWAGFMHLAVLVLIPLVIRGCGWESPYTITEGSGEKVVTTRIKRVKQKVEHKKLILSMNTDILFYRPDPDESDILNETQAVTQNQYEARGVDGKPGEDGGKAGGWPEGMPGRVRFIRLEYNGGDWDQDLQLGADDNMLIKFGEMTGLKVARSAEHRAIPRLKFFPEGKAPPFVFITGRGGVTMSSHETRVLRDYCLEEGGMIFADNGGGSFDSSFRGAMARVFPDKSWIRVSKDDPIFRYPYLFPSGAPPLWHHSGREALGLRHNGRWIAFYHPGDLNDAWKTGHSGIHEGLANQAYKLGINVMYYAFSQYLDHHKQ